MFCGLFIEEIKRSIERNNNPNQIPENMGW